MFLKRASRRLLLATQIVSSHGRYSHFIPSAAVLTFGSYVLSQKAAEAEEVKEDESAIPVL
jgi:hypothetical protein